VNLTLVDVVCDWAKGVSFAELTTVTLVQEGSIVRCITRLDELCREVRGASP
jgi:antiviral helicase SKI2